MGDGMRSPHLQRLEMEAYTAVLRALAATQMDWQKERLMTEIRRELNISTEDHFMVLEKVMNDAEITAIREGAPLPMDGAYGQPMADAPSGRRSTGGGAAAASGAERKGPGRPPGRGRLVHASGEPAAAVRKRGKHRSSGTQVNELIGRTIWRHWPMEQVQWAKGTITDYKPATNEHTVVYDINTPDESYEEVNLANLQQGRDFELAQDAPNARPVVVPSGPPPRTASVSRSQKRKAAAMQATSAEKLPYPAALLQERLAAGNVGELEAMRELLEAHARALVSGLVASVAPESDYPDPAERLQLQLQDLAAREAKLTQQLAAMPAAA